MSKKVTFIQNHLPNLIIKSNDDLSDHKLVKCEAKANIHLDGFMSEMFSVDLWVEKAGEAM